MGKSKSILYSSLYWRISGLLLLILLVIGVAYMIITTYSAQRYYQETTQRLNADVAEHMLLEVQPFIDGKVNEEAVGQIMHSMMAVNPGLEVYLLDQEGQILQYVVLDENVKLSKVSIDPVKSFIKENGQGFILGDDPRNPGQKAVFSATAVYNEESLQGYVYLVLASEQYENISSTVRNSLLLKTGSQLFIVTLIAAFSLGLLAIWLITKNLRTIIQTVRRFEQGDLEARIPVKSNDELGGLATTFNRMADTLIKNIDQLKQVDHLRKELIANISHDLRTPLSVIHGYVETLSMKKDNITLDEQQKYLNVILKSTDRLKDLVSDLFQLSQLEARQVEPHLETFAMAELINDLTAKYQVLASEKHVTLNSNIEDQHTLVNADLALIERVMQNLLDNALQHTPENGEINLSVSADSQEVNVAVSNTGEGIPEEEIEQIFDRYYTKSSRGSEDSGSGLGLAIVKNILEIHNSMIQVKSQIQDKTTFFFKLPQYTT